MMSHLEVLGLFFIMLWVPTMILIATVCAARKESK